MTRQFPTLSFLSPSKIYDFVTKKQQRKLSKEREISVPCKAQREGEIFFESFDKSIKRKKMCVEFCECDEWKNLFIPRKKSVVQKSKILRMFTACAQLIR